MAFTQVIKTLGSVMESMKTTVNTWLSQNITNPSNPPLDRSLSLANACAPADLVGAIKRVTNMTDLSEAGIWELGSIGMASGNDISTQTNSRMRTGYLSEYIAYIEALNGTGITSILTLYAYNSSDNSYVGHYNGTQFVTDTTTYNVKAIDLSSLRRIYPNYIYRLVWYMSASHVADPQTDYINIRMIGAIEQRFINDEAVTSDILNNPWYRLPLYAVSTCVNKSEVNLTSNTTILAFGDSITAGSSARNPWTYYINEIVGCSIINHAVGSALYGESTDLGSTYWISTQIAGTTDQEWESADLVVVAAGNNDASHNTPLQELKEKVLSAIVSIRAKTSAPILFITPTRRGANNSDAQLLKLPYISAIIANVGLANRCSIIVGLDFPIPSFSDDYIVAFSDDHLHPNNTGAYVYAMSVINAVM